MYSSINLTNLVISLVNIIWSYIASKQGYTTRRTRISLQRCTHSLTGKGRI